jgi:hypothetical protein
MKDNLAQTRLDPRIAAQLARASSRLTRPAVSVEHDAAKSQLEERPIPYFLRLKR